MKFSVLMSIYKKEKKEYFVECIESILNQTLPPNEIVLVKDGPLTDELNKVIDEFIDNNPLLFKIVSLKDNVGLGKALSIGVKNCSYDLIARMDTDDICVKDRFLTQINEFKKDSNLDILGSSIIEFDGSIENIISKRIVPLSNTDIYNYAKKRNPFNHMTVIYKKSAILSVGNYLPPNGFEDYYLWARLLVSGYTSKNLIEPLVYARTGITMFERRGGYNYLKRAIAAKKLFYKIGLYTFSDFLLSSTSHIVVSLLPNKIRGYIYLKVLRKEKIK